jgi:hypothetical protein
MDFTGHLRTPLDQKDKKKPAIHCWMRVLKMSLDIFGLQNGAGGRNRTDMPLRALDFESSASTSFTTPAIEWFLYLTWRFSVKGKRW